MRILLIPPNDLLRHPIPNRVFHLTKRLAKRHEIFLLSYTKHPLTGDTPRRSFNGFEVQLGNVVKVRNLGLYYMVNALPPNCGNCEIVAMYDETGLAVEDVIKAKKYLIRGPLTELLKWLR